MRKTGTAEIDREHWEESRRWYLSRTTITGHYEDLKHKTIADLREIARGLDHEEVKGFSQLNKEHLLPGLCAALGIDAHEHHHVIGGFDKRAAKKKLRVLRTEKQSALETGDRARVKALRRRIHRINHQIRAHVR